MNIDVKQRSSPSTESCTDFRRRSSGSDRLVQLFTVAPAPLPLGKSLPPSVAKKPPRTSAMKRPRSSCPPVPKKSVAFLDPSSSATVLGHGCSDDIDMSSPSERAVLWHSPAEIAWYKDVARALALRLKQSEAQKAEDRRSCVVGDRDGEDELVSVLRAYREKDRRRGRAMVEGAIDGPATEVGGGGVGAVTDGALGTISEQRRQSYSDGSMPSIVGDPLFGLVAMGLTMEDVRETRGLEFRASFERQRNKFIAHKALFKFQDRLRKERSCYNNLTEDGFDSYPAGKIAFISCKVSRWARNLAWQLGLEDFKAAYPVLAAEFPLPRAAAAEEAKFPLHFKKRKNPASSLADDLSSLSCSSSLSHLDQLSSSQSCSQSGSGSSGIGQCSDTASVSSACDVSLSSMQSARSIQSNYANVRPMQATIREEEETMRRGLQQLEAANRKSKRRMRGVNLGIGISLTKKECS